MQRRSERKKGRAWNPLHCASGSMRTDPASQLFHLPVNGYRYLLVISPAMDIAQAVDVLKAQVERAIGTYRYRHSKAHITLFHADLPVECRARSV